jgi:hypothetical protein
MILDILIDTLLVSSINLDICLGVGISIILFNMLLNFSLLFNSFIDSLSLQKRIYSQFFTEDTFLSIFETDKTFKK